MPIIRKFGQSKTDRNGRFLVLHQRTLDRLANRRQGERPTARVDIAAFLGSDPDALIAQWASSLDKTARKPSGTAQLSLAQNKFRAALGRQLWKKLTGPDGPLKELTGKSRKDAWAKWRRRVIPIKGTGGKSSEPLTGRLFDRLTGLQDGNLPIPLAGLLARNLCGGLRKGCPPDRSLSILISVLNQCVNVVPTTAGKRFRSCLGNAIWEELIRSGGHLAGLEFAEAERLRQQFETLLHKDYANGSQTTSRIDGRYFPEMMVLKHIQAPQDANRKDSKSSGLIGCSDFAAMLAQMIRDHLMGSADTETAGHRKGLIAHRAASIKSSFIHGNKIRNLQPPPSCCHTDYCKAGDVAQKICDAQKSSKKGFGPRDAAAILFAHYPKVFTDNDAVMTIAQAKSEKPTLFSLHEEIKDFYKTRLSVKARPATQGKESGVKNKFIHPNLPKDFDELKNMLAARTKNRNQSDLMRQGRIIHYEAADSGQPLLEKPGHYHSSDGQTDIKLTEAFVRVWRSALSHANRNLANWLAPSGNGLDIRGDWIIKALEEDLPVNVAEQTPVLFGSWSRNNLSRNRDHLDLIKELHRTNQVLRDNSFHFTSLNQFVSAFQELEQSSHKPPEDPSRPLCSGPDLVQNLLRDDSLKASSRLRDTLLAAHVDTFLTQPQLWQLWSLISSKPDSELFPLPRFNNIVRRASHKWGKGNKEQILPKPVNRSSMEKPEIHCRYVITKLIYERSFRSWLSKRNAIEINSWITKAEQAADKAAQQINGDNTLRGRMTGMVRLTNGENIQKFLSHLARLTAGEFRVQAGYEPDRQAAKEQADWLNNLQWDVVILAFCDYAAEKELDWLPGIRQANSPTQAKLSNVESLPIPPADQPTGPLHHSRVYALLHLIPVEEVGKLLHQLRRWDCGRKAHGNSAHPLKWIEDILSLYLDSHDAKFRDQQPLHKIPMLTSLFESTALAERAMPPEATDQADNHSSKRIPTRALREALRFGSLYLLSNIFKSAKITEDHWNELAALEALERSESGGQSKIAAASAERERLHQILAKSNKNKHENRDKDKYKDALITVIRHRRLSNHVRLVNHVRLNQILMSVLGRFSDMAGIYERDIYFTLLGLCSMHESTREEIFCSCQKELMNDGRILEGIEKVCKKNCSVNTEIRDKIIHDLRTFFPKPIPQNEGDSNYKNIKDIRNDFSHFNMLQTNSEMAHPVINLTAAMNHARILLSYDRKKKNAISASIATLLDREQVIIRWDMTTDHKLTNARCSSRQIKHLENEHWKENLRDECFLTMVSTLFGGRSDCTATDVTANKKPPIQKR